MPAHMRTLAKPRYSAMSKARKNLKAAIVRGAKDAAKERDGYRCRRCGRQHEVRGGTLEASHVIDQGMGGRHSVSCERMHYVSLCRNPCHRDIVHGEREQMVYGARMGDGPVQFVEKEPGR